MERDHRFYAVGRDRRSWERKIYLVGAGVGGARICHAGCGVCAPAARGRDRARTGERQSGGRGADRAADYREKMLRRGMNPDAFHFYLDTFKNGMPPHGGFAIGLERITACFLGIANVKECSMFPRDINRVAP